MKGLDDGVRHEDPHASSKASVTDSSAECIKAKKIASESCGQVNAAPAESVKETSPEVSSVAHETQEELQKPRLVWICAGRPFDDHDLTFETLRDSPANVLYVSYFPVLSWLL